MPNWWDNIQNGLGQAYMPNYGSLDPQAQQVANRQAMMQLGAGLLANSTKRPGEALGRSLGGLQQSGMQAMQAQAAAEMMNMKRDEYRQGQEERTREREARNQILKSGNQEAIMRMNLGDLKGALAVAFPNSMADMDRAHGSALPYQKPDGTVGYGLATKGGGFMEIPAPGGATFMAPYDRAYQGAQGKAAGEAAGQLPGAQVAADQTIREIDTLLTDPNIGKVSGIESYAPDPVAAAAFGPEVLGLRRRVEQLRGKAFLEAYNMLRGGGQITEAEGAKAEAALARLDTAQNDQDYVRALRDFQEAVRIGIEKLQAQSQAGNPRRQQMEQLPSVNSADPLNIRTPAQ